MFIFSIIISFGFVSLSLLRLFCFAHLQCQAGDKVKLRVGGDFYYDPQPHTEDRDLLLIAGGVGINPLFSMLQHFLFLHSGQVHASRDNRVGQGRSISLLYSAISTDELIFQVCAYISGVFFFFLLVKLWEGMCWRTVKTG